MNLSVDDAFDQQFRRLIDAMGVATQVELAALLDNKKSAVSDAKRRGTLPTTWLKKLRSEHALNPTWVMTGVGDTFLADSEAARRYRERRRHSPARQDSTRHWVSWGGQGRREGRAGCDHPVVGVGMDASGLLGERLPAQLYILPAVAPKLDPEGGLVLTGPGAALPRHQAEAKIADPATLRSLDYGRAAHLFDTADRAERPGLFIVGYGDFVAPAELAMDPPRGFAWTIEGTPVPPDDLRILGRVVWVHREA